MRPTRRMSLAARRSHTARNARSSHTARVHAPLDPLSLNVIDPLKRSFVVAGICAGPPDTCHALHAGHTLHAMHAAHTLHALHSTPAGRHTLHARLAGHTHHALHAMHAGHTLTRNARRSRSNCMALHAGRTQHSERAVKTGCPQVSHDTHPQRMAGKSPRQCTHVTHCTHCTHYTRVTQLVKNSQRCA